MDPTREALERALSADPDDLATHAAYADYLIEQGDPRGDYIRLELALAGNELTRGQRRNMNEAAYRLFEANHAAWLGPFDRDPLPASGLQLRYGWVESIDLRRASHELVDLFLDDPRFGLLRHLTVSDMARLPLYPDLIGRLARGPSQHTLRSLSFQYAGLGDDGVARLLDGPLLDRLNTLEIVGCDVTDDGAQLLAADPRVPKLARFSLEGNLLSPIGIAALAEVGVAAGRQRFAGEGWSPLRETLRTLEQMYNEMPDDTRRAMEQDIARSSDFTPGPRRE